MYEYNAKPNPLNPLVEFSHIEYKLDNIPIAHPYVPRLCNEQGHMLLWYGTAETDPDLVEACMASKNEEQWITCDSIDKIELGVSLIYPYDDEIIIGSVKVPGYFNLRTNPEIRAFIKTMWRDIIVMFGDRKIICPSGGFFNYLHLSMNQKRIPREAYHREIMQQFQFKRDGDFWIRHPNEQK